jgi:hypothetical protein
MRTFMGFVNSDGQLYSSYQEGGQIYLEPIGSFSDANAAIDNRSQNTQQESSNNTRIAQQVLDNFKNGGSSAGASSFSSGASTFGGTTQGMTLANMGSYGAAEGSYLGGTAGYSSTLGATEGFGAASQGGISGMSSGVGGAGASGAGGSGGAAAGGMGAAGVAAIVAAIVAAQHYASNNTEREFEGVKTDDAFAQHWATDPWIPYMYQKMGINTPTRGEKFDAAVENKDWDLALRRSTGMFAHDPIGETTYDIANEKWGSTTAAIISPGQALMDWITKKIGG